MSELYRRGTAGWLACLLVVAGAAALAARAAGQRLRVTPGAGCADPASQYPATRDPSNPLALRHAPGLNPLHGATFFVPGPAHGAAASTIAQLVGASPEDLADTTTWGQFRYQLQHGALAQRLSADPTLRHRVFELSKIAQQPEAQRISSSSGGGGPGAIYAQTAKIFCDNMAADPRSVPIFNTYFLHADLGGCPTPGQVRAYMPTFHRRVDEMAQATGRHPAVFLLELDALGSSSCVTKTGAMPEWEAALRYEIDKMRALPHTLVYVEGGYSDSNSVAYTAQILNRIEISKIRGFFTNDTHNNWTVSEARWATEISQRTHGAHFIVNTSNNGRGPLLNSDPATQGNEDLCNPPGRGLGPQDTTDTGYRYADAWMWTHPPGNSSGCGGGPSAGTFWPAYAIGLAQRANNQLGPSSDSHPYAQRHTR